MTAESVDGNWSSPINDQTAVPSSSFELILNVYDKPVPAAPGEYSCHKIKFVNILNFLAKVPLKIKEIPKNIKIINYIGDGVYSIVAAWLWLVGWHQRTSYEICAMVSQLQIQIYMKMQTIYLFLIFI